MTLYDPKFLPEESDDLLDFFDLVDEDEPTIAQPFQRDLTDVAYEQGMGEFQLRELLEKSTDGQTIRLQGKAFQFQKGADGKFYFSGS